MCTRRDRLAPSGHTLAQFAASKLMDSPPPAFRKYRRTGFATPSGKVELTSSILADLGFDPLPYHREGQPISDDYPYRVFSGVREDPFFQTGQRNIEVLRRKSPSPKIFVHPTDAKREGLADGDWVRLETASGHVTAKVAIKDSMLQGHLRVPHGGTPSFAAPPNSPALSTTSRASPLQGLPRPPRPHRSTHGMSTITLQG
jgi:anaerobic selenocysteine-containing dehydrogenase